MFRASLQVHYFCYRSCFLYFFVPYIQIIERKLMIYLYKQLGQYRRLYFFIKVYFVRIKFPFGFYVIAWFPSSEQLLKYM